MSEPKPITVASQTAYIVGWVILVATLVLGYVLGTVLKAAQSVTDGEFFGTTIKTTSYLNTVTKNGGFNTMLFLAIAGVGLICWSVCFCTAYIVAHLQALQTDETP
jgi:hypothetical protein